MKTYINLDKVSAFTGETEGTFNAEIVDIKDFTEDLSPYCDEDMIEVIQGKFNLEARNSVPSMFFICGEASSLNHDLIDFIMTFLTDQAIEPTTKQGNIKGYTSKAFAQDYFLINDQGYYGLFCEELPIILDYTRWYKSWTALKEKTKI
jgi:hypothetical protein